MKKTNRLLVFILVLCMIFTGAMLLVGCGDKDDNATPGTPGTPTTPDKSDAAALQAVAGTYSNTWYEDSAKRTQTVEITTAKKWKMTSLTENGLDSETTEMSGTFEINAAKQLTEFKFDDFAASQRAIEKFAGVTLPAEKGREYSLDEVAFMEKLFMTAIDVHDGYLLVMSEGDNGVCLYKSGVQKHAVGTVLRTLTVKEFQNYASVFTGRAAVPYESDYYLEKLPDGATPTEAEQKEAFLDEVELGAFVMYANDIVALTEIRVTDVTAVDLTTAGTRNATLTYKNGTADATRDITYTVVNGEDDFPEYSVVELGIVDDTQDNVNFQAVAKNTQLYDLQWKLGYRTWLDVYEDDPSTFIAIDAANASGANPIITITGYDPATTGIQTVTFTYKGKSVNVVVFVYDETVNPVTYVCGYNNAIVTITKEGDSYTADYRNAKAYTYKVNDEQGPDITFTEADAVNLRDLSTYEDGDTIVFKYEVEYDGNTYTFYVEIEVEVVVVPAQA